MILRNKKTLSIIFAGLAGVGIIFFAWTSLDSSRTKKESSATWEIQLAVAPREKPLNTSSQINGVSVENENFTKALAENMMATYLTQKTPSSSTTTMSNSDTEVFVENIIKETLPTTIKQYTKNDILIVENNDANTKLYQNKLGQVFDTFLKNEKHDELFILSKALSAEDAALLEPLNESVTVLRVFIDSLLTIEVPEKYTEKHLFLLQIGETLFSGISDFQNIFTDPIRGMQGVVKYNNGAVMLINARQSLSNKNL